MTKTATKNPKINYSSWGRFWRFVLCAVVPLGVGGISAAVTMNAMKTFGELNQPPLSPPAVVFPVVWSILYVLMGIASFLIFWAGVKDTKKMPLAKSALVVFGAQLVFNFCWTLVFFNLGWYWPAFIWLLIMLALIVCLILKAHRLSKAAVFCLVPLLLWTVFAGYLNFAIALMN